MRGLLRALALASASVLAACTPRTAPLPPGVEPPPGLVMPRGPGPAFTPVRHAQIPGWTTDRLSQAVAPFLSGCLRMAAAPGAPLGGQGEAARLGGDPRMWADACAAARAVPPGDDIAARAFFESQFQAFLISNDGAPTALFTGYYEPEVRGSRKPDRTYHEAIYRRPPDLGASPRNTPYLTRAQIDGGALAKKHLEILYLADPVDAFFLHIQGSGRVRLPDGRIVRLNYDGQNGQPYVPIGRVLVDRGEMTLEQVSMQSIRTWLATHPKEARGLMQSNPSYVFFRELPDPGANVGPPGTLGAPLTPMRSVAVDRGFLPLGAPIWIDTKDAATGETLQRLMLAQDIGGAIRGPVRADIFYGWTKDAEDRAGRMRAQGTIYLLLPKGAAR
jgi:membrane-bound lytic murein transglycosylase A